MNKIVGYIVRRKINGKDTFHKQRGSDLPKYVNSELCLDKQNALIFPTEDEAELIILNSVHKMFHKDCTIEKISFNQQEMTAKNLSAEIDKYETKMHKSQ